MSERANPRVIGAFVVGAIALAVVGIVALGSGRWFRKPSDFVLYFSGSVNGLRVDAPVKFRGVEIGSVKDIMLSLRGVGPAGKQQTAEEIKIPVIIQLDERRIVSRGALHFNLNDPETRRRAIGEGLRAQLATDSFVTGLLYIDLDITPKTPGTLYLAEDTPYPQIPTLPSSMEQIQTKANEVMARLDEVNLAQMVNSATETSDALRNLVDSPKMKAAVDALEKTANELRETAASIRKLSDNLGSRLGPIEDSLRATSDNTGKTMEQARTTLRNVDSVIAADSPLNYRLEHTLEAMSSAADSIRNLADYLERNPSSLVRGKDDSHKDSK